MGGDPHPHSLGRRRREAGGQVHNLAHRPGVYTDALSLEQARRPDILLAYRADNAPLAEVQGFPLRLVIPPMYGYKGVKWVNGLELTDRSLEGYWEVRGYPVDAWIG